ncbi:hypothetical protein LTR94_036269, partial [Friedmanniomyces endolithicus]
MPARVIVKPRDGGPNPRKRRVDDGFILDGEHGSAPDVSTAFSGLIVARAEQCLDRRDRDEPDATYGVDLRHERPKALVFVDDFNDQGIIAIEEARGMN